MTERSASLSEPAAADPHRPGLPLITAVLALICVGSLAAVLLIKLTGGQPWVGLDWIAMLGLPLAFVLMCIGVLQAIARRRRA
ncbi:hypothetical protein IV498_05205 [Paenarthrobacter sp. Z7-10]|uniref:hypothetical protein n=1 Tax=Paenarthrobacter sp. Z7-10 TaxID=2787635 RepID=UPI0022A98A77|nr:hypothetical protein [Paenarthrobacter sp. Z7-10]MCZ2402596.1 hypothetical protein [Paenarthrobacter sp. Z7-10]